MSNAMRRRDYSATAAKRFFRPLFETLEHRLALAVAVGLTPTNEIAFFDTTSPGSGVTTPSPVTGLISGDTLVGIDFRPATGELYGLGVNGTTAHLYRIGRFTGSATQVGGAITIPQSGGVAGAETSFGFDFNPVVDRIRVVANNGDNFRLNPDTGAVLGPDSALNPGTPVIAGAAYTNNLVGATSTTLYVIDSTTDQLFVQGGNPVPPGASPNTGTLTLVGSLTVDTSSEVGFDILTAGGTNTAFAVLQVGATSQLYNIDLVSGAASLIGPIDTAITLRDIAITTQYDFGDAPVSYGTILFPDGARHGVSTGPFLGATDPDVEPDGQPSPDADGDDLAGIDDEDGVTPLGTFIAGATTAVEVEAADDGLLDAWIDFDGSGSFDADEQIAASLPLTSGSNGVVFTVPIDAAAGTTFARFRYSSAGGLGPAGFAPDGEVEDYAVPIVATLPGTSTIIDDTLVITGTSRSDVIVVEPRPSNPAQVRVRLNGRVLAIVNNSDFDRLVVLGLGGNDTIIVSPAIHRPTELHGNNGNDHLFGGPDGNILFGENGNDQLLGRGGRDFLLGGTGNDVLDGGADADVLLGGDGNDKLFGQAGRDILIGGLGRDLLDGGRNDDILIGGTTDHDNILIALLKIHFEWVEDSAPAADRIDKLNGTTPGGANDPFLLTPGGTVHEDGAVDRLISGIGFDWFFVSLGDGDLALDRNLAKDRLDTF
jgi:Ca2+-binding RTX toxin-like protein